MVDSETNSPQTVDRDLIMEILLFSFMAALVATLSLNPTCIKTFLNPNRLRRKTTTVKHRKTQRWLIFVFQSFPSEHPLEVDSFRDYIKSSRSFGVNQRSVLQQMDRLVVPSDCEGQGMSLKLIARARRLGALHVLVHIKSSKHSIYRNNLHI